MRLSLLLLILALPLLGAGCDLGSVPKRVLVGTTLPDTKIEYQTEAEIGAKKSFNLWIANQGQPLHECRVVFDDRYSVGIESFIENPYGIHIPYGTSTLPTGKELVVMNNYDRTDVTIFKDSQGHSYPYNHYLTTLSLNCAEGSDRWQLQAP